MDARGEQNQKSLRSTALDHTAVDVTIVKLPSQNFSQVVRFKLLLRDISLRTFFLNDVLFDMRESVDQWFPTFVISRPHSKI